MLSHTTTAARRASKAHRTVLERDAIHLAALAECGEHRRPHLAICLGIQLNVALGGTLHQRTQELKVNATIAWTGRYRWTNVSRINIPSIFSPAAFSRTSSKAPTASWSTRSTHTIDQPGEGVFVEAISDDGVIEAVSAPDASRQRLAFNGIHDRCIQ